jgi:hypothetical protein
VYSFHIKKKVNFQNAYIPSSGIFRTFENRGFLGVLWGFLNICGGMRAAAWRGDKKRGISKA